MVKVVCDICGKESEMWYSTVVKCNEKNELITCGDKICKCKKCEDTCIKKYGVKCSLQSEEVKNKIKDTNLERYGCEYPSQSEEIKNKIKDTNLERYGCTCSLQSEEIKKKTKKTWQEKYGENITSPSQVESIKNKIKATNLERYGHECTLQSEEVKKKAKKTMIKRYSTENPIQNKEIKNKIKTTNLERYGSESPFGSKEIQNKAKKTWQEKYGENITNPFQVEDIKNKILSYFQFNGTGPSSRAQRYINHILNGTLNKHICGSLADIYIEKENIVIEHDGSGHFLTDKFNGNKTPTKESLLYEKERENKIISNGYKMIRFIAVKDRIPSDEVILNLIEEFKNSDFKVIRINFEESTIEKDYEEKIIYDFGELRKITQKDLEQFEK